MRGRKLVGRITAAVLAACMVAALFPAAAFADAAQSNTADIDSDKGLHEDGSIAISKANFPDDNFRKYLLEIFDAAESATTAGNGQTYIFKADKAGDKCLTKNELESRITHIYCKDWGIESLEGIEYFKALNWLDCENNKLTNAEMSAVTSNEQLQKTLRGLQCAGNLITELDVSGCHNLETLGCIGGKAKLTTLKVNPELHVLYCYNNNIGALDVSACTQLIELNCDYNPRIGALDVSHSPDLLYLFCQKTGLTQLDVSHNPKLRTLRCNYNDLQTLNVTKNPALRRLFCTDIGITSLDLTKNPDLTMLNVSDNQLTNLALIEGQFSLSDPDDPELVPQFTCSGNKYQIVVGTARTFDLKTLPGGFEAENVTIRSGGSVDANGILTVDPNVDKVTYTYNCGAGQSAEFTLLVHTHHFGGWMYDDETRHKHLCKDDGDVEYEDHTYDETGTTCTKCGYQKGHTWEWAHDTTGHWLVSTTDGTRTDTVSHEFSIKLAEEKGKADQLVCACGYTIDGVAINQKNFPDDNFRNYISAQFDTVGANNEKNPKFAMVTPGDHFITSGELAGIIAIDCSSLGIKSLEGIELFTTALTSLMCNDNGLAASGLDVSALKNLKVLHAQSCGLTELDLSQNKQLQDLGVNSNSLTELDLSSCKEMLYLWAQNNQLANLNLTGLSKIQDVGVSNNKLTELDLSDKTKLDQVCIQKNNLTNLKLGGTLHGWMVTTSTPSLQMRTASSIFPNCRANLRWTRPIIGKAARWTRKPAS